MGDSTRFLTRAWRDGDDGRYRDRMREVWEAEAAAPGRPMRYTVYFDAKLTGFGEAVMTVGALPIEDVRFKCNVPSGRFGIAFTTDFHTWQTALSALRSCQVRNVATYQNEVAAGTAAS